MDGFLEIYRSKHRWKSDMLMEALAKQDIVFFQQDGIVSGLQLSPFTFACLVPYLEYIVYVPPASWNKARRILEEMPFDLEEESIRERKGLSDANKKVVHAFLVTYILCFVLPLIAGFAWQFYLGVVGIVLGCYSFWSLKKRFAQEKGNPPGHL